MRAKPIELFRFMPLLNLTTQILKSFSCLSGSVLKFQRIFLSTIQSDGINSTLPKTEPRSLFKNQTHPIYISKNSPNYDPRAEKFINRIMRDGKKLQAQSIYNETLLVLEELIPKKLSSLKNKDIKARDVFFEALDNLRPVIQVRLIPVMRFKKKVPLAISDQRSEFIATKNLMSLFDKHEKIRPRRIAGEIINAYQRKGKAYNKKISMHKESDSFISQGRG